MPNKYTNIKLLRSNIQELKRLKILFSEKLL